jgi:hypothetical protein
MVSCYPSSVASCGIRASFLDPPLRSPNAEAMPQSQKKQHVGTVGFGLKGSAGFVSLALNRLPPYANRVLACAGCPSIRAESVVDAIAS